MITIVIDNPKIEKKYSDYEIKMKFIKFPEQDMEDDIIDFYEISESNLSEKTKNRLKKIDKLNFIEY
jgi:hypothetical protein